MDEKKKFLEKIKAYMVEAYEKSLRNEDLVVKVCLDENGELYHIEDLTGADGYSILKGGSEVSGIVIDKYCFPHGCLEDEEFRENFISYLANKQCAEADIDEMDVAEIAAMFPDAYAEYYKNWIKREVESFSCNYDFYYGIDFEKVLKEMERRGIPMII